MRVGINNYFGYLKIVGKSKVQQVGSSDSAMLILDGMIEKTMKRGTVSTTKKIHVPIVAKGRTALAMDLKVKIDDFIWVIGEMDDYTDFDIHGVQQRKLMVKVSYFDKNKTLDIKFEDLFKPME